MLYAAEQARIMAEDHPDEAGVTVEDHPDEARAISDDNSDDDWTTSDIDEDLNASFGESTISADSSIYEHICKKVNGFKLS